MKFNVELTEQADKDLRSIYLYISVDLNKANQTFMGCYFIS